MTNSVSKEYSNVLYDLGLNYQYVIDNLNLLKNVLQDDEIMRFFKSPVIKADEKKKVIKDSLRLKEDDFLYFLYVLVDNKRLDMVDDILSDYSDLIDEKLNIGRFFVYSSKELSDLQIKQMENLLCVKYGKKVILDVNVDENLIGGIVIKYKNNIIDDSVSGRLTEIKNSIVNN